MKHPRWVRINTILTTWEEQKQTTFAGFKEVETLKHILEASSSDQLLHLDPHIPNLVAVPAGCDLSKSLAYQKGEIIFQDKASCFPAYLLNPTCEDGAVVDACAAPGNKTTHLAAILASSRSANGMEVEDAGHKVFAFERNKQRTGTLRKMVKLAGADPIVHIVGNRDFLTTEPSSHKFWGAEFDHVGALLLDPSCSGSGIVGRDDEPTLFLPSADADNGLPTSKSKKRKRKTPKVEVKAVPVADSSDYDDDDEPAEEKSTAKRLTSLSAFQLQLLKHAMKFPDAKKIVYSTCSIHVEENESVVVKALISDAGRQGGWRLLHRDEQVKGLRDWHVRGEQSACESVFGDKAMKLMFAEKATNAAQVADACIRCERGTSDGTMGFFVAGFVRDERLKMMTTTEEQEGVEEEEWNGFSDDDGPLEEVQGSSAPGLDDSEVPSSPAHARQKRDRKQLKLTEAAGSWCR
jgi:putative methyltransferase